MNNLVLVANNPDCKNTRRLFSVPLQVLHMIDYLYKYR